MSNREQVIALLKSAPILIEGNRNNDAVNLAIVAYDDAMKAGADIDTADNLTDAVRNLVRKEDIPTDERTDWEYMEEKAAVLMDYLPDWRYPNIYAYTVL